MSCWNSGRLLSSTLSLARAVAPNVTGLPNNPGEFEGHPLLCVYTVFPTCGACYCSTACHGELPRSEANWGVLSSLDLEPFGQVAKHPSLLRDDLEIVIRLNCTSAFSVLL